MVCLVLHGFIQVYSVFRVLHSFNIQGKNELNPFPYCSIPLSIVKDAPEWYWMACLSNLEASSYLWTISADCLSLESSQIPNQPLPPFSAPCTNRKMVTYSDWQDINQLGHGLVCSLLEFVDWVNVNILQSKSDSCNKTCNLHIEL